MEVIREILSRVPSFVEEYDIFNIESIQDLDLMELISKNVLEKCGLFIYQPIRRENRFGEQYSTDSIKRRLKSECITIAIPNTYGMVKCFFPQCNYKKTYKTKILGISFFFLQDYIIEDGLTKGKSIREICADYMDAHLYEKTYIVSLWEQFICDLEQRENECDVIFSDIILRYYDKIQLFNDPCHPTDFLLKMIAERILLFLGIPYKRTDIEKKEDDSLIGYSMPYSYAVVSGLGYLYTPYLQRNNLFLIGKNNLERYIKCYYSSVWNEDFIKGGSRGRAFCYFCSYYTIGSFIVLFRRIRKMFLYIRKVFFHEKG